MNSKGFCGPREEEKKESPGEEKEWERKKTGRIDRFKKNFKGEKDPFLKRSTERSPQSGKKNSLLFEVSRDERDIVP